VGGIGSALRRGGWLRRRRRRGFPVGGFGGGAGAGRWFRGGDAAVRGGQLRLATSLGRWL